MPPFLWAAPLIFSTRQECNSAVHKAIDQPHGSRPFHDLTVTIPENPRSHEQGNDVWVVIPADDIFTVLLGTVGN